MSTPIDSHAEETLTELAGRFEHWRQSRTHGRARIPEDLWDQAVALSMVLPNARVARRLRLSPTDLRKQRVARQGPSATVEAETPPAFVDITPSMPWSTATPAETQVEFERPDGARMYIRVCASATPLVTLVRTFLEAR
jgi:hypothetical protein